MAMTRPRYIHESKGSQDPCMARTRPGYIHESPKVPRIHVWLGLGLGTSMRVKVPRIHVWLGLDLGTSMRVPRFPGSMYG